MGCAKTKLGRKRYCIGNFRHGIQIYSGMIVPTSGDYDVTNNTLVLSIRAMVKTNSGSPFFDGVSMANQPTHTFTIPYTSVAIETNMMLLMNGEYYNIENIQNENEDSLYLIIKASKRGSISKEANWR